MLKRAKLIDKIFQELLKSFDFDRPVDKYWSKKDDIEWVSELDLEIDKFLTKRLNKFFPGEKVFSEEGKSFNYTNSFWIIDPLDGTHNFLAGLPLFGISIAYCDNSEIVAGGILLPKFKERWIGEKGKGVWLNNQRYEKISSSAKPIVLSESSFRKVDPRYLELLRKLSLKGFSVRLTGCSALNFVYLIKAGGVLVDQSPQLWDIAAGVLLLQELGGQVVDFQRKRWQLTSDSLVITFSLRKEKEKKFWEILDHVLNQNP